MAKKTEIRAYQILNFDGKMAGKKVDAKKINPTTAYEIVQRERNFAYRIVQAEIEGDEIKRTWTMQGGDDLTFDACVEAIANYRAFSKVSAARFEDEDDDVQNWHGRLIIEFESTKELDSDEVYDLMFQAKSRAVQKDGGLFIPMPKGMKLTQIELPDDETTYYNVFLPETF